MSSTTSGWSDRELAGIGAADELRVSSRRPDGTLTPPVTIWVARCGDDVYVRSAHGPDNGWFRRARTAGSGHVSAGGVDADVRFEAPSDAVHADLDRALHAKYDRYGPAPVGAITGAAAHPVTLRVVPDR